jgi:putative nucleotidyltransferase with HDIG domain
MTRSRDELAKIIPSRPRVRWWIGLVLAVLFGALVLPAIMSERLFAAAGVRPVEGKVAPYTVRVPPFAGFEVEDSHIGGGGIVVQKGKLVTDRDAERIAKIEHAAPRGAMPYLAVLALVVVLAAIFSHHTRRSNHGRLLRVQLVSFVMILLIAAVVKLVLLSTAVSVLVVPVALLAMLPTLALDRIVGLATGVLAALVFGLLGPFDVGVAILLLVQVATAGLVIPERPKARVRAVLIAGVVSTACTALTYPLLLYFTAGRTPLDELHDPLHSMWLAAALGPAIATVLALPLLPLYQLLVGEITTGKLIALEDLSHPLLRQIAERAPGTWQHSLMMANLAELAANAIGANGRLVRVGAYFHDLGKSIQPKYFIENLEPGEASPHDQLAPEVSCDVIFAHVTEGIVVARKAGLHERIVDFMHMHHGNGVLEYFWGKAREQGNPKDLSIDQFRYPGVPPQSRETAILAICDAVEAASRTLKKPDPVAIDNLVQRIIYGKLHLGQLDESGLSMSDLRLMAESLRETIRHANHNRIEYPWQKAEQDASASGALSGTSPRLDSLDRPGGRTDSGVQPVVVDVGRADTTRTPSGRRPRIVDDMAIDETAPVSTSLRPPPDPAARVATAPRPAVTADDEPAQIVSSPPHDAVVPQTLPGARMPSLPPSAQTMQTPASAQVPQGAPPAMPAKVASPTDVGRAAPPEAVRSVIDRSTLLGTSPRPSRPSPAPIVPPTARTVDSGVPASPLPRMPSSPTQRPEPSGTRPALWTPSGAPPSTLRGEPAPKIASAPPITLAGPPAPITLKGGGTPRPPADPDDTQPRGTLRAPDDTRPHGTRAAPLDDTEPRRGAIPDQARPRVPSSPPEINDARARTIPRASTNTGYGQRDERSVVSAMPTVPEEAREPIGAGDPPPIQRRAPLIDSPGRSDARAQSPPTGERSPLGRTPTSPPVIAERPPLGRAPTAPPAERRAPTSPPTGERPPLGRASTVTASGVTDGTTERKPPPPPRAKTDAVPLVEAHDERSSPWSTSPPPPPAPELDTAITIPPPLRRARNSPAARAQAVIVDDDPASGNSLRITAERAAAQPLDDDSNTQPSLRIGKPQAPTTLAGHAGGPRSHPDITQEQSPWSAGLAARIDAALDDDFGGETPVIAPTKAELRALLGQPDVTRQASIEEIEALRLAADDIPSEPDILRPRHPMTEEVMPEDIEAAIELAPPARRHAPNIIAVAKKKKPE